MALQRRSSLTYLLFFSFVVSQAILTWAQSFPCPGTCSCNDEMLLCNHNVPKLTLIPQGLPSSLRHIIIRGHRITFIGPTDLSGYPNLEHLDLRSNAIRFISYTAFANNTKLETIDLEGNQLMEIQPFTFSKLTSLQNLYLQRNRLSHLQKDTFAGLTNLMKLDISSNRLNGVSFSSMKPVETSLVSLTMANNPINCDCEVIWMQTFEALESEAMRCSSPKNLEGVMINDLQVEQLDCAVPTIRPDRPLIQGFKGQQRLEVVCRTGGNPPPTITWVFQGRRLEDSIHYRLLSNGNLLIVTMLPQLAGEYMCIATSAIGNASAIVTVEYVGDRLPAFIRTPKDTHVFVGGNFSLTCSADEVTESYQWTKDGDVLSEGAHVQIQPGRRLAVVNVTKEDAGVYQCLAINEEGSVNASATVNVTGAVLTCDGLISPEEVHTLMVNIDLAFNATQRELQKKATTPGSLLRRLRFPESGIIDSLKAAEIFDQAVAMIRRRLTNGEPVVGSETVPFLSKCELEVLRELSGCEEHKKTVDCSSCFHRKHRSYDGSCNNLDNPLQGAAGSAFKRLLKPAYEDGIGLPVGWSGSKPSARQISQKLISAKKVTEHNRFTHMLMQVGQFLDHDMDLAPVAPSDIVFDISDPNQLSSCDDICNNDAPCFPIPVAKDDTRIKRDCLPFTRSSAVCGTGVHSLLVGEFGVHREQLNVLSSYVDGSQIYGSSKKIADRLRELDGSGKLKPGEVTPAGKRLLPFDVYTDSLTDCSTGIHAERSKCFLAGDIRVNEQVGLISIHTIFFREHNRVVDVLAELNPHWNGEKLYQEARRIVIAEWQNIVYSQYLPKILGPDYLGIYTGYLPTTDSTISNGFATAAYRFGHSQIMPLFPRLDSTYEPLPIGALRLQDAFFSPFRIVEEGGIDPLIRGLIFSPVKQRISNQVMNNNLTEALFVQAHEIGLDLASLNIQRGRDHGLPSYNKWREFCGLSAPDRIEGLQNEISNETIRRILKNVYGDDPDNIDLFVGGILEDNVPGSQLGPTFLCIIGDQFRRLREGDRFFFERDGQFTPDQLLQLKQASLSKVVCDNADNITTVPVDALVLQETEDFVPCSELPTVDLSLWKECEDECVPIERNRRSVLLKSVEAKITRLEEKIGMCKVNGVYYKSGESWKMNSCTECTCEDGGVDCSPVDCKEEE